MLIPFWSKLSAEERERAVAHVDVIERELRLEDQAAPLKQMLLGGAGSIVQGPARRAVG